MGRCPTCGAWGSMSEEQPVAAPTAHTPVGAADAAAASAAPIGHVALGEVGRISTGLAEFDRVLGGGLVPGVAALLGGEPGIGKSTLLLQAAERIARAERTVLYISGEESTGQVRLRAERLGALAPTLLVASDASLPTVAVLVERHRPDVLVVDSLQTLSNPVLPSAPGSIAQVRECAAAIVRLAKRTGTATILVGHVTKDGELAGPRVLQHLVDVVCAFEGERIHALRLLRGVKNRFGAAGEVGCFEMGSDGLREVPDPSKLFLSGHDGDPSGVAVTVAVEGPRPLTVEVQALVARSTVSVPRRQASGIDAARLPLLCAVLQRRAAVDLAGHDLFASAVGGVRLREPAVDLAVCLAIASSRLDRPVPRSLVAVGEVGLAGEIRPAPQLARRLGEAARLGFARAVVASAYDGPDHGLTLHRVGGLSSALAVGLGRVR